MRELNDRRCKNDRATGIHRVASALEQAHPRLGRKGITCRHRPSLASYHGAKCVGIGCDGGGEQDQRKSVYSKPDATLFHSRSPSPQNPLKEVCESRLPLSTSVIWEEERHAY